MHNTHIFKNIEKISFYFFQLRMVINYIWNEGSPATNLMIVLTSLTTIHHLKTKSHFRELLK